MNKLGQGRHGLSFVIDGCSGLCAGGDCSTDDDCGSDESCENGTCVTKAPVDCPSGQTPDINGNCCPITQLNTDGTCSSGKGSAGFTTGSGSSSSGGGFDWSQLFKTVGQVAQTTGQVVQQISKSSGGGGQGPASGTAAPAKSPSAKSPSGSGAKISVPTKKTNYTEIGVIAGGAAAVGILAWAFWPQKRSALAGLSKRRRMRRARRLSTIVMQHMRYAR